MRDYKLSQFTTKENRRQHHTQCVESFNLFFLWLINYYLLNRLTNIRLCPQWFVTINKISILLPFKKRSKHTSFLYILTNNIIIFFPLVHHCHHLQTDNHPDPSVCLHQQLTSLLTPHRPFLYIASLPAVYAFVRGPRTREKSLSCSIY